MRTLHRIPWPVILLSAVVAVMTVYPLIMVFYGSIMSEPPGGKGHVTLTGYIDAFSDPTIYRALWTTLWLSVVRTLIAVALAIFLSWVVARTDTPWRGAIEIALMIVFFLPNLPMLLGWIMLAAPRSGFINVALVNALHLPGPPLNIFSYGGIIFTSVISWVAILVIIMVPAFKNMDASLEEASLMSGAGRLSTLWRLTVPLLSPSILGATILAFVRMMESFETELFLGYQANIYVFSTKVYDLIQVDLPPKYPKAMALSAVFLVITFGLVALQSRLLQHGRFTTVSGRGFRVRAVSLGPWRYATLAAALAYLVVATVVPLGALILGSLMKVYGLFTQNWFTMQNYAKALGDPVMWESLKNTLIMGFVSATVGMIVYSAISYIVTRTRIRGRHVLDFLSWLPYTVPGMVLSLGLLWVYVVGLPLPFTLYGTLYLLILVFITRGFPLGVRTMHGTFVQLGAELEESSRVHGASGLLTLRRIVMPLAWPGFMAGWLIVFVIALRDLSSVVLLYGSDSRVLAVRIFEYYLSGQVEVATVIGLITLGITLALVLIERVLRRGGSAQTVA